MTKTAQEIATRLEASGATSEEYKMMNQLQARFTRTYYGEPFVTKLYDFWFMCIEDCAGYGSWRPVSEAFAKAWFAEFGTENVLIHNANQPSLPEI